MEDGRGVTEEEPGGHHRDGQMFAGAITGSSEEDSDVSDESRRDGRVSTVSLHSTSDTEAACGVSECGRDEGLEGGEAWRCARCWVSSKGKSGTVFGFSIYVSGGLSLHRSGDGGLMLRVGPCLQRS